MLLRVSKPLSVVADEHLLEAAAQSGFHSSVLLLAFDDALSSTSQHPLAAVFLARVERFKLSRALWVELVSACDGRVVDPVSGDGLAKQIEGCVVVFCDDGDVVGLTASGHWCVDTSTVDWTVYEEEGGVDGAALGGVDRSDARNQL